MTTPDLYDQLDFGIVLIDADERVVLCNRWMRSHARLHERPCLGQPLMQSLDTTINLRLQSAIEQALRRGHSSRLSSALHPSPLPLYDSPADTQRMRHAVDIVPVQGDHGRRSCLLQVRDMTESYRREELLRHQARQIQQSEQRLAATLEHAPIGMALSTLDGRWTYVNKALCELLGQPAQALQQRCAAELVHPLDRERHQPYEQVLRERQLSHCQTEERWTHHDGSPVWVRVTATRVDDASATPYLIQQIEPIGERKRREQQIAEALQEKETLLREVYHRVKNNLQVIQSLLNLKRSSLTDAAARTAFTETAERVRAMALVHEKLYQSSQLSAIDLGEYLRDLMPRLQEALGSYSRGIQVELHTAPLQADLNTAIPFGLIVTELVSNSLKHAFPNERRGLLRVEMLPHGPHGARLVVADDGIGLPAGGQRSRSLGLTLVDSLTRQLDGQLQVEHGPGVRFTLTLPRLDSHSVPAG